MDASAWLLNDEVGIKDFWTMWGNAAGADDQLRRSGGFRTVPCDLDMARELVGDALAIHARHGVSPPAHTLLGWHMGHANQRSANEKRMKLEDAMGRLDDEQD